MSDRESSEVSEAPVLIAGGGLVGLCAAAFLAQRGIPSLTVERLKESSPLPRAAFFHMRTLELFRSLGIEQAVWLHSGGGKRKRPTHVANSGKRFNVAEGWFDPDPKVRRHIHPGELINCRCVCRPVVKGFT